MKNFLPKKLSACLRVAIKDLKACRRSKKYNIRMGLWFREEPDKTCSVCLAGSVMAKTCGVKPTEQNQHPVCVTRLSEHDQQRLEALNELREGHLEAACQTLDLDLPLAEAYPVADYDDDPDQFFSDMERLAEKLEALNL